MARRKTTRKSTRAKSPESKPLLEGWWHKLSEAAKRRALRVSLHALILAMLVGGVAFGLRAAREHVRGLGRYHAPLTQVLIRPQYRVGEVVVTTRTLADVSPVNADVALPQGSQIPTNSPVLIKAVEPSGRMQVECRQMLAWVEPEDVIYQYLLWFPHVRDRLVTETLAAVREASPDGVNVDWLRGDLARRISERIGQDAYVARVLQVDKQLLPPGASGKPAASGEGYERQIVVNLELRRPIAQIWYGSPLQWRGYILDAAGVVLEQCERQADHLPRITNFDRTLPELRVGRQIDAPDLRAGLELARLLATQPYFDDIVEVDVDNYDRRANRMKSELVIVARRGRDNPEITQRIGWGARLRSGDQHEWNDPRTKLGLLLSVWRENNQSLYLLKPYNLWQSRNSIWWEQSDAAIN